jgi:hypothetical protein
MQKPIQDPVPGRVNRKRPLPQSCGAYTKSSLLLLAATITITMILAACGGSSSGSSPQSATLSGNWQFTMAPQSDGNQGDPTFNGGLLGGFLLQKSGAVNGQAVYSITSSQTTTPCNGGSATITGTLSGQGVTITAVAGAEAFALTGTLSADGSTMMGNYTSTVANGTTCGYATTQTWSAILVPSLTGAITGSFHSNDKNGILTNQDFLVTGVFTQGENIGASNATVTGTLSFIDPLTNLSDYPCFDSASVNGQISGNSVILQIIGNDGSTLGQIGAPAGSSTGVNPVTFVSVSGGGNILQGAGSSYITLSKTCPGAGNLGSIFTAGDSGNICLAIGSTSACQQPVMLTPASISFSPQQLGTTTAPQTITLKNTSSTAALTGLTATFSDGNLYLFGGQSDFTGLPEFFETDNCGAGGVPSMGQPFSLSGGASCTITVTFDPQESCPWLPFNASGSGPSSQGAPPEFCPLAFQNISLALKVPSDTNPDHETNFAVPITGIGLSVIQPSTPELDFSSEEAVRPPESSPPQTVSFTNTSTNPVQILPASTPTCQNPLPRPLQVGNGISGIQMVGRPPGVPQDIMPNLGLSVPTINYNCDIDPSTLLANFQISSDTCTGTLLAPHASCSLQIAYVPQPNSNAGNGPDYFLELNTLQCSGSQTSDCELDSGRFPLELKANPPSPLRMAPSAGLDFGNLPVGQISNPLTITLSNDATLTNPQTVTFIGKIGVSGSFSEIDDCQATLAPGSKCTLTVSFKSSVVGFTAGKLTINYTADGVLGNPQLVYLRGTGQ